MIHPRLARIGMLIDVIGVAWILMHMYMAWKIPFSIDEVKVLHLGFASVLLYLFAFHRASLSQKRTSLLWLTMVVVSLFVMCYFFFDYDNMVERIGVPSLSDVLIGTIFVLVVLWITWKEWGYVVPLLTLITIAYGLYGNILGGVFFHSGIDFARLTGYLSTYFMGTLGGLTGMSATVILHFLLFGALLEAVGGAAFFEKLSIMICSRFLSGAGQVPIYSSALFGMISGSTAANVAVDGAHTIPMMKRRGYHPDFAGAVEAAASTGGQIMPPVMGVTAFILAALVGISYARVCIAALLPAFVFYAGLSFSVMIYSRKMGFTRTKQDLNAPMIRWRDLGRDYGHLIIPIGVLTWRLMIGESPSKAVLYANLLTVILGGFHRMVLGRAEPFGAVIQFGKEVFKGLLDGAREGAKLAVILGTMGIIIEMFTVTGFGQRLSYAIVDLAGNYSFILVMMVAVLTIFFGMGMPTPGAYLLAVLLSAPALIKFGFPELSVHMFVFYFAIISALTPPVAIGILVAVGISGGSYLGTAKHALRLALPGFLIPFYFLYQPAILDLWRNPLAALQYNLFILIGMFGINIFFDGYFLSRVGWLGRGFCLTAALMLFHPGVLSSYIGIGMLLAFGIPHFIRYKKFASQGTSDPKRVPQKNWECT